MPFCHLHHHDEWSVLDGVGTAKEHVKKAVELGHGKIAQSNHGTISGSLHHIEACKEAGIVPIIGVEAYFRPDRIIAKANKNRKSWHLGLYAKNLKGWHNLLELVTISNMEVEDGGGFYDDPCIDFELLLSHSEGLACLSGCISSWVSTLIQNGDSTAASEYIDNMLAIFGDDFYIEIQPQDFDEQRLVNLELVRIAKEKGIPLVATNDVHFPHKEWAETHKIAKICGISSSLEEIEELKKKGKNVYLGDLNPSLYLCSEQEMYEWFEQRHPDIQFSDVQEAINNTELFAQRITPFMLDKSPKLPRVTETPEEAEEILRQLAEKGLRKIFAEYPKEHWDRWPKQVYRERFSYEWNILKSKGVFPYFVMIADIVLWAKKQGIRVGLGRGSAAGCLISYLVGITAIDPISWGFLFERFLNPERKGLPDIDLDFDSERRDEVKKYISEKYGKEHVADIITHARFQPKSVIQDISRVYNLSYSEVHDVTDDIEIRQDDEETTLEEILPMYPKLQAFKEKYPHIWDHALILEGTVRQKGKHAAGVVITPKPIRNYMALERGKKEGDLVTSFSDAADFQVIADYGFLKADVLGIKGLTKHDYACKLIKQRHGIDLDLNKLPPLRNPYDVDPEVLEGFSRGYTIGVFQFQGGGITNLIKEIKPDSALDLCAANALYRPGPMKSNVTWEYAKKKHGRSPIEYPHELTKTVLEETYGIICYQEEVMEIAKVLGGFSGAEADDLRKAMGKLYRIKGGSAAKKYMRQYEDKWFDGCKNRGIGKSDAKKIWNGMLEHGHYSFCKPHSGSYTCQGIQDMFLKMKFPIEQYAAMLTYPSGSTPKEKQNFISQVIREARSRDIKILPPDINTSEVGWTCDGDALRVGLVSIKGIGDANAKAILQYRQHGQFESIDDFRLRIPKRSVNKKAFDALVRSGAFDKFGARSEATNAEIAQWEKELINMNLTASSNTNKYANILRENIYTQDEVNSFPPGSQVIIGGEVIKVDKKKSKRGDAFANVTIVFELNEWKVKFWKESLNRYNNILKEGATLMIRGSTDEWKGFRSVVASDVTDVETLVAEKER